MDTEDVIAMDGYTLLSWFGMIVTIVASLVIIIQWLTSKPRKSVDVKTGEEEKNEEEKREENKDEEVFQGEARLMEEQHEHRQISMETTSSQGSLSAETGPSSSGTQPHRSQVTTKTAGTRGRVRGPIKEPERTNLKENIPKLLKIITEPDLILESLCARDVFDGADREKVERQTREKGKKAGVTELLNLLLDCGGDALQLFGECLVECGYYQALKLLGLPISEGRTGEAVKKLENTTKEEQKNEEKASSQGSSSAETGVAKSMSTRDYQAKQSPSSTGTKPCKSQVTTKTADKDESGDNDVDGEQTRQDILPDDVKTGEGEKKIEKKEEKVDVKPGEEKKKTCEEKKKTGEEKKKTGEEKKKTGEEKKKKKKTGEEKKKTREQKEEKKEELTKETKKEEVTKEKKKDEHKSTRERVRGPIKEPERTNLKKNIPELLKIITEPDLILESLCAREVFDGTDREMVERERNENGKKAGVSKLLNLLLDCGTDAFQLFGDCLREQNYIQALKLLGFNGGIRRELVGETGVGKVWRPDGINEKEANGEKVPSNSYVLCIPSGYVKDANKVGISRSEVTDEMKLLKTDAFTSRPTKVLDKTLLRKNMPKLLQILTDPDVLINSLLARGVFGAKDIEMMKKETQEHDKQAGMMKLFSTLQECGPDACQLFGECLKEHGYTEAMELLEINNEAVVTTEQQKFTSRGDDERLGIVEKTFKDSKHPLHKAVSIVDNIHDLTDILEIYRDQINSFNSEGETVFTCAMLSASTPADKLKLLLDQGADRKLIQDKTTREHILQMCKSSPISVLKFLIDNKLITISNCIPEVLFQVCKSDIDPVGKLEVLLSNGGDLHVKDGYKTGLLHTACESGSLATVTYLINTGLGCSDKDGIGQTPLYYCCRSDIDPVGKLEVLLCNGVDLHVKDGYKTGLLHVACESGSLATVKYLINTGLGCSDKDGDGQTPLYYCCISGKDPVNKLEVLLSNGSDLHVKDGNNRGGLLHTACESGSLETVRYLINTGLGCNDKDSEGQTPLYYCCVSDKDSVGKLEVLLSNGSDLHVQDVYNIRLLHTVCMSGSLESVKYLITKRLSCNDRDSEGQTSLYYCCMSDIDSVGKLEVLLSNGGDLHVKDFYNRSLLHTACQFGSLESVKYLINQGLVCNDKDSFDRTSLYYCCKSDIDPVDKLEVLLSNGGELYVKDGNRGLLHTACESGSLETVKYFINQGLRCNDKDSEGQTPLYYCCMSYKDPVDKFKYLVSAGAEITENDKRDYTRITLSVDLKKYLDELN